MKTAIYLRQSLDLTGEELGIERQRGECQRLCSARGYQVVETIVDNSVSASKHGRPGYGRLNELIEARAIEAVVILRVDRLMRLNDELEDLVRLSEQTGVKVITVEGDIDLSTPAGRLVARVLVSVARAEIETKSARHKLANTQRAAKGLPYATKRPFGYEADLVTICEPEAMVLRQMAEKIISGWSFHEVAWWANKQGYTTTGGKRFLPLTIRGYMKNRRYGGIRAHNGVEYPAVWLPIFDETVFEQLHLTIKARAGRRTGGKYLLTGMAYCGQCGMPLGGTRRADYPGKPNRRVYTCRATGDATREHGCAGVVRNADALEHFVAECLFYRLDTPELAALLGTGESGQLKALLSERERLRLKLSDLVDDYATGLLNRDQFGRAKAVAEKSLAKIEGDVASEQGQHLGVKLRAGETVREAWQRSESDEWKRQLLGLVMKAIRVNPSKLKPFYYVGEHRYRFDPTAIEIEWLI